MKVMSRIKYQLFQLLTWPQ